MRYCFITGVSRGIGKALALILLEDEATKVFGYSRTNPEINDDRFEWYYTDLSDTSQIKEFDFPEISLEKNDEVILINNAAIIGDINFSGKKDNNKIIDTYTVNIIAPSIIINKFMGAFCNTPANKTIMNISSGAGRHPIVSWSDYCATKSAMDMLSETIAEELEYGTCNNTKIFSVAPGIVDTAMQEEIRLSGKEKFPHHETFVNYKTNNLLWPPDKVTSVLKDILDNPGDYNSVLLDVREL